MADDLTLVGNRLAEIAVTERDPEHFDLFSRSAFNRYYYSTFLTVRIALARIDSRWAKIEHATIPPLLKGQVVERLRKANRKLEQAKVLDGTTRRLYSEARTAAHELSWSMDFAREVRRVADYEPQEKTTRNSDGAKLANCTTAEAKRWQQRAEIRTGAILRVYDAIF